MPNQLERIHVSGYKSIRDLNLQLHPLTVLIGANGSGKSNFISVFRLLNEILENRLQTFTGSVGADNLLYYGRKFTNSIDIELVFTRESVEKANGYKISLIPTDNETLIFAEENVWFHVRDQYPNPKIELLGRGHRETKLFEESRRTQKFNIADFVIQVLSSWKIYHFHDTSRDSKMKQFQNIDDNLRLQPDASNIAAFLYFLQVQHPAHYKRIVQTVRRVTPFFEDFVLHPSPRNPDQIRLQWMDRQSADMLFNAHALSDGTLRFICLATLLLQPTLPSLILIDEPELGLHPFAIDILKGLLESAARQTQVIVSTQSVPLINQLAPEQVLIVDRKEGQSTFNYLEAQNLEHWMTEYSSYGLGDLWEKNIIGGRPQPEF